ncbi:glutamine-hydrolyzing carbamoyl-phosphate synthase small subunit [bacterium]|nr:glutamine-hydrolyzing carbamoyl-phosphate synthase small subunit [bacterium]
MKYFEKVPARVLLQDGTVYDGWSAGKIGTTTGEICFNTGMTGYQEVFTDPSYYGQIITMTNVHIGNYGIKKDESESKKVQIRGLITRNYTNLFSRHQADAEIQQYLLDENIVAITGVDTRALVRHVRDKGAMNCILSTENIDIDFLKEELAKVPSMTGLELSTEVSTDEVYYQGDENAAIRVAVLDLGVKNSILRNFADRDVFVKVFPAHTPFTEIADWQPHGYFASNGPGDPGAMDYAVETVSQMLNSGKPFFGICLGHQIFARSQGVSTYKMHNGHRGINHPVINLETGKCEVTSQNHGFSISESDVKANANLEITHMNLNDDTIEGIRHKTLPAFSVQYHPEAAPGPNDAKYLFDNFINLIKAN